MSVAIDLKQDDELSDENYFGAGSDCLVISSQQAIATYPNQRGHIVIRQERGWDEDEDAIIIVHPSNLPLLIRALQAYLPGGEGQ